MAIKAVRGFKDILPPETYRWQAIEEVARDAFEAFGFQEIRIPILEKTEVFSRGIGEHTDIVEKEMYTFEDRNGESITLRPEATAGIIRAYIENKLFNKATIQKLFTIGPMFRYERPQKGRLRQFHQINAEFLGSNDSLADTEIIWLAWEILRASGIKDVRLEINSLGCPGCRPGHRKDFMLFLENNAEDLCPDCKRRMKVNPLRVFDCKKEQCKKALMLAPVIKHYWCPDCSQHLGKVLDNLECLEIPFVINPYLVRGLDYYQRTTFEIKAQGLGAQDTVAAGGRYDGLVHELGGPEIPGVGMAIGMERAALLMEDVDLADTGTDVFFAILDRDATEYMLKWMKELRVEGIVCETSYEPRSLKAQLRMADRLGARYVVIVGEDELDEEEALIRDMKGHDQSNIPFDEVPKRLMAMLFEEEAQEGDDEDEEEED